MTFRVLIIEDNHSFIDTLKVMLRDLPLDFCHAYRYNDAQAILERDGIFHNRPDAEATEAPTKKVSGTPMSPIFNENGIFLIIVEQNTETSMKGTDFVTHAMRKFPGLSESDFILLTHRLDSVPSRNYGFPVLEKPLRVPQIRQIVLQKIKQAQELAEAQSPAKTEEAERGAAAKAARKGLRKLLKMQPEEESVSHSQEIPHKQAKKPKPPTPPEKTRAKSAGRSKKTKPK